MTFSPETLHVLDPALYDDPWEAYAWLRDQGIWFDERAGLHAVTRHADVTEISRDAEHFSAAQGVRPVSLVPLSIVSMDDPEHARQRRLLSRGFTPRQVRTLTDHVRTLTNEVIDEVQARGEIDFVGDLAMHVPLIVISELLGLDPGLRHTLYRWSDAMIGGEGHEDLTHPAVEAATNAFVEYTTLVSEVIEARRTDPRDDLLSILTQAYDSGELGYDSDLKDAYAAQEGANELTNDELLMFCVLLMVAGNETTRNAIAGGLRAFTAFPAERQKLIADPELIDSAVEEIVRWTSPVLNFTRTVTGPVSVGGTDFVAGDRVLLLYQAANRDPRAFEDPDVFRVDRDPNPHLGFGFGPHYCMGANLARMEIKVVFEELFRRLPDIEVTDPHALPERTASAFVAGIHRLPARFTPVG